MNNNRFKETNERFPDVFPKTLIEEMRGLYDACIQQGSKTVTWERIITLNYGFDWLVGTVYNGQIPFVILETLTQTRGNEKDIQKVKEFVNSKEFNEFFNPPGILFRIILIY